jgi:N-acetylmuramoyl-L-alanine amidase
MRNVWYFIEASGCVTIFYCLYLIAFRNTTFFRANRIYLVAGIILSFIIPSLDNPFVAADYHVLPTSFAEPSAFVAHKLNPNILNVSEGRVEFPWLLFLYWSVVVFMVIRFLISIRWILQINRRSCIQTYRSTKIFVTDSIQPFSFFNMIFMPKGEINPLIFQHENAHVQQRHWIDLLVVEIACALLWFNPVMVLYRRSVKTQLEYEADSTVIEKKGSVEDYLNCILNHLQATKINAPISQFFNLNIKQRIIMMTKNKTPRQFSLLYFLFVPLVCLLLLAFSNHPVSTDAFGVSDETAPIIIVDAGHGGTDDGAQGADGTVEKDLMLSLARIIQKEGQSRNVKVILTRTGDQAISMADRVSVTERHKASLFISLHANFHGQHPDAAGIEIVVSERNVKFEESKAWSNKLVQELTGLTGVSVNGVKNSDFYVLSKNSIPAVLLELGYLSNKADNAYLNDQKNQQIISQRIIGAVLSTK